jgi:hypothetical protein
MFTHAEHAESALKTFYAKSRQGNNRSVFSTKACMCYPWTCLFYSRLCYPNVSVLQQPVLPLDLSATKQSVPPLSLDVSVHTFAVPGAVWLTATCAAPGSVCLQEPVLHLYVQCTNCPCAFVLPLKVSVYKRLCCTRTCAFMPALEVSVYKSLCCTCTYNAQIVHVLCAAPESVCLQEPVLHLYVQCTNCTCAFVLPLKVSVFKRLCCTCTCAFLPALEVFVYKSLYCTCTYNVQIVHMLLCCP